MQSYKQPPNLLGMLSNSAFITQSQRTEREKLSGIFLCERKTCKICEKYLQKCTSFVTSSGAEWKIKCYANCSSKNALYYVKCNYCNITSKVGKTDDFRKRTNNHISACRHGKSSDEFDNHVFNCCKNKNVPYRTILQDLHFYGA